MALAPSAVILVVGTFGLSGSGFLIIPAVVLGLVYVLVSWRHLFSRTVAAERAPAVTKGLFTDEGGWSADDGIDVGWDVGRGAVM